MSKSPWVVVFWLVVNLTAAVGLVYLQQERLALLFTFLAGACWERLYRD